MKSNELNNIQLYSTYTALPDNTGVKFSVPKSQSRYNAKDLGTSGAAFSGMYFGNAMEKASQIHNTGSDLNLNSKMPAHIAIVDNFTSKIVDVDGDIVPDLSHGETVERYLKAENPNVIITRFEVDIDPKTGNVDNDSFLKALKEVKKEIDTGTVFSGVNMSIGYEVDLSNSSKISPSTIAEAEAGLRNQLFNPEIELSDGLKDMKSRIEAIEAITACDVPVYISAGNDGKNYYNSLGMAKGTIQVGALSAYGDTLYARNSDVKEYAQGEFVVEPTFASNSEIISGYDINEDGKVDVDTSEVSGKGKLELYPIITGTSFSTPVKVGKKTK